MTSDTHNKYVYDAHINSTTNSAFYDDDVDDDDVQSTVSIQMDGDV